MVPLLDDMDFLTITPTFSAVPQRLTRTARIRSVSCSCVELDRCEVIVGGGFGMFYCIVGFGLVYKSLYLLSYQNIRQLINEDSSFSHSLCQLSRYLNLGSRLPIDQT